MSFNHHVVVLREINEPVERSPVVVPFSRIQERPFALIFWRQAVKLLRQDSRKLSIIEVGRIYCPRPNGDVFLSSFFLQRGSPSTWDVDGFGGGTRAVMSLVVFMAL